VARPEHSPRPARPTTPSSPRPAEIRRPAAPPPQLALPGLERAAPPQPAGQPPPAADLLARIEADLRRYNDERSRRD
jgi:hypothetical protein